MAKSFFIVLGFFILAFPIQKSALSDPPLPPNTAVTDPNAEPGADIAAIAANIENTLHPELLHPARLVIPSAAVDSTIIEVGVNDKGEMDVPDGSGTNVGWYKYGTIPGHFGSAVIDAHVFAAFSKLKRVKPGNDIYVVNEKNEVLHFRVIDTKVYPLSQVPLETLFGDASGKYLNLITCAGTFVPSKNTYTHRRIVYAELVEQ